MFQLLKAISSCGFNLSELEINRRERDKTNNDDDEMGKTLNDKTWAPVLFSLLGLTDIQVLEKLINESDL